MAIKESTYNIEENQKNVVYTSNRLVTEMLSSVQYETVRIDSRVLEPSCGDGNFLEPILRQKLSGVLQKYGHSRIDIEFYILRALMSIYGVEIESNVVLICRKRLKETTREFYLKVLSLDHWVRYEHLVDYVLATNIICGDALSLTSPIDGTPIVFAEWSFLSSYRVKRRDYIYEQLVNESENAETTISDRNEVSFIPKPVKEYTIMKIFNIASHAEI